MTAKFTVDGSNLIINFQYTAPVVRATEVAVSAAHYLWEHGYGDHGTEEEPILFDDLTNQEKLNLVDKHVKRVVLDIAKDYHVNARQEAERELAIEYANENIIFDGG